MTNQLMERKVILPLEITRYITWYIAANHSDSSRCKLAQQLPEYVPGLTANGVKFDFLITLCLCANLHRSLSLSHSLTYSLPIVVAK